MLLKKQYIVATGAVGLVLALTLAVTAKTPKRTCINDTECGLIVGTVHSEGDIDGYNIYSNASITGDVIATGRVFVGPTSATTITTDGFTGSEVNADVVYTNELYANFKAFRIDHPLDPANKFLNHWSVESDELKNIYDGMVTLDENGAAAVSLPSCSTLSTTISAIS
jgi:hypothetical protein